MREESFQLEFNLHNKKRLIDVRTEKVVSASPVIALYRVYCDDEYQFTVYPTFNEDSDKVWEVVEQEITMYFPLGFFTFLGLMIEDVYIMN
jgi:hypothetical protein